MTGRRGGARICGRNRKASCAPRVRGVSDKLSDCQSLRAAILAPSAAILPRDLGRARAGVCILVLEGFFGGVVRRRRRRKGRNMVAVADVCFGELRE